MVCSYAQRLTLSGYLPAEHIETPTERLARLNKHRNIDVSKYRSGDDAPTNHGKQLSATQLGDTAEKSKNPLKKAMRRRMAKNVTFGIPTYVDASEYEYSSDEEDAPGRDSLTNGEVQSRERHEEEYVIADEITQADPTATRRPNGEASPERRTASGEEESRRGKIDDPRPSDESAERK